MVRMADGATTGDAPSIGAPCRMARATGLATSAMQGGASARRLSDTAAMPRVLKGTRVWTQREVDAVTLQTRRAAMSPSAIGGRFDARRAASAVRLDRQSGVGDRAARDALTDPIDVLIASGTRIARDVHHHHASAAVAIASDDHHMRHGNMLDRREL